MGNYDKGLIALFCLINMEKIGFKVPEVAKNMSMQEAKLLDIADQLGRWPAKK